VRVPASDYDDRQGRHITFHPEAQVDPPEPQVRERRRAHRRSEDLKTKDLMAQVLQVAREVVALCDEDATETVRERLDRNIARVEAIRQEVGS